MEKTIRCPDCGDNIFPEFGMCPVCLYRLKPSDYHQQGMKEEDFTGIKEINMPPNKLFGKIKVFGFILVVVFIIVKFLERL
ncbi:MAG: hypothetical protein C0602_02950 [Denitrovibrio sp.]|nr:MAG: hypothetical protein C0602_02950 [Denitrovibrio sp.]